MVVRYAAQRCSRKVLACWRLSKTACTCSLWLGVHSFCHLLPATAAGRYFGSTQAAQAKLPFPAGFEAVGVVAAAAPDVQVRA